MMQTKLMTNQIQELQEFIERGRHAGLYGATQARNLTVALRLAAEQADVEGLKINEMPISEIEQAAEGLIQRRSKASQASQTTYISRLRRLFADFKASAAGEPKFRWRVRIPKVPKRRDQQPDVGVDEGGYTAHKFPLPASRRVEVRLPDNMTKAEIGSVWKWLTALKSVLELAAEEATETVAKKEGE